MKEEEFDLEFYLDNIHRMPEKEFFSDLKWFLEKESDKSTIIPEDKYSKDELKKVKKILSLYPRLRGKMPWDKSGWISGNRQLSPKQEKIWLIEIKDELSKWRANNKKTGKEYGLEGALRRELFRIESFIGQPIEKTVEKFVCSLLESEAFRVKGQLKLF